MQPKHLFTKVAFLVIIEDSQFPSGDASQYSNIVDLITANGGTSFVTKSSESENLIEKHRISHILTESWDFAASNEARDLMIPVTTMEWFRDCILENKRKNYRLYLPKPVPAMSKMVVCVANNLPLGDKEMMYTAARLFGGQYLDLLSRYTTHLIAVDRINSKAVIAANLKLKKNLDVKIVLPAWFAECIRQQRHVSEEPYLLSDRIVCETGLPNKDKLLEIGGAPVVDLEGVGGVNGGNGAMTVDDTGEAHSTICKTEGVLIGKGVFISPDFNLSKPLIDSLESLLQSNGGHIVTKFSENDIDIYLCRYRSGDHFKRASLAGNIHIGLLLWIFHVIFTGRYVAPLESNLLFSPVPKARLHKFQNLRISITGINGDARHYLTLLINAMGAGFTKTLDRTNDILVCGVSASDKILAAQERWPNIKVVNYLWVEECYSQWKYLDPKNARYKNLDEPAQFLGKARLSKDQLSFWLDYSSDVSGVDDSADESEAAVDVPTEERTQEPERQEVVEKRNGEAKEEEYDESSPGSGSHEAQFQDASDQIEYPEMEDMPEKVKNIKEVVEGYGKENSVSGDESVTISQEPIIIKETISPGNGRASRSAKQKASLKLHSDMEDLNKYLSISKSSKKMKDYMAQLELRVTKTPTKRNNTEHTEISNSVLSQDQRNSAPAKKKQKLDPPARYIVILTGCERNITLKSADISKLAAIGIVIVNDYNASKRTIDTIVAPKVLRTEKFLKCLSRAERIVHPDYLHYLLAAMAESLPAEEVHKQVIIDDYSLEKRVPMDNVNSMLGYEGSGNGLQKLLSRPNRQVFNGFQLNLSKSLNGGAELIQSILVAHGLSDSSIVKVTAGMGKQKMVNLENGNTVLVANKSKDPISKIKGIIIVDWDWCVKCLFNGQILPFK